MPEEPGLMACGRSAIQAGNFLEKLQVDLAKIQHCDSSIYVGFL